MAQVYKEYGYAGHRHRFYGDYSPTEVAARIVTLISGILTTLLAVRFIFMLFGANSANGIASFVYTTTRPFVAPFFGLFNHQAVYGHMRVELESLLAIVFYALLAWVIIRLLMIGRPRDPDPTVVE